MKNADRAAALSLRVAALTSKLGFMVVLAMFLDPAEVGLFGLIAATISFSLYFIGLDFYIYSNREFRVLGLEQRKFILSQTTYLFCASYALLVPAYLLVFFFEVLPWSFFYFVISLAILEHLSTELYRLLIIIGRPVLASFSLFIRLGFWPLIVAGLLWVLPEARTLSTIMYLWIFGAVLSIAVPFALIAKKISSFSFVTPNWQWISTGLKITLPFLVGTLCVRGIQTLDRYILSDLVGAETLGAFVFFASLASLIPAMLQAGVYSFVMPKLVSLVHDEDWSGLFDKMRTLKKEITFSVTFLAIAILVATQLVMKFIENPLYDENYELLYFAIVANCIFATSMYFHLALYALKKDRGLAVSHVFALLSFLLATGVIAYFSKYYAVPIGIIVGNFVMLLMKSNLYKMALKETKIQDLA